jgi:hypothetical protein
VTDLRALAERLLETYLGHARPDAALLAGSAVTGGADEHSDVDLLLSYDALPADDEVEAARTQLGGSDLRWLAPRSDEGLIEQFLVDGTHVQVAHIAVAGFEADLDRLVADPDPYLMKAMQGLHAGLALHGSERIGAWRERGAYTEELQRAVVRRHWRISRSRDCTTRSPRATPSCSGGRCSSTRRSTCWRCSPRRTASGSRASS